MPFTDRQWLRVLTEISDGQVVPVIGPELLMVNVDGTPQTLPTVVAREIVPILGLEDRGLPENPTLEDVVCAYSRFPGNDPDELYLAVREVVSNRAWETPEALRKLADIRHFDLYISITFDDLMTQALNETRFAGAQRAKSFAYSRVRQPVDLPAAYKPSYAPGESPPEEPAVYHLFGRVGRLNDWALREDDLLQFCHRFQSRDLRPENLFDVLRCRSLLVLGCGFPGWLTRFFLAGAKGESLFSEGARGVLADRISSADSSLALFLERRRTSLFGEGDAAAFVDKLHEKYRAKFPVAHAAPASPTVSRATDIRPGSVFISYASENRSVAELVRDQLEAYGVEVWFDRNELGAGDVFHDKILRNIENCCAFVPILSAETCNSQRRFLYLEWNKSVEELAYRQQGYPFLQPVAVDAISPDAWHLPPAFRDRHWEHLESGRLPDGFVGRLKELQRDYRRERRAG